MKCSSLIGFHHFYPTFYWALIAAWWSCNELLIFQFVFLRCLLFLCCVKNILLASTNIHVMGWRGHIVFTIILIQ